MARASSSVDSKRSITLRAIVQRSTEQVELPPSPLALSRAADASHAVLAPACVVCALCARRACCRCLLDTRCGVVRRACFVCSEDSDALLVCGSAREETTLCSLRA